MKKLAFILSALVALSCCSSQEEKIDTKKISKIIKNYNNEGYFSGVAIIAKGNKVLFELVNGKKNDANEQINRNSQFFTASVSKQFTAVATLIALHQSYSKLYQNDQNQIISEVKNALKNHISVYLKPSDPIWNGKMPSWADKVTLHQLLSNTSGIENYSHLDEFLNVQNNVRFYQNPHSPHEIIDLVKDKPLLFEPGKGYNYSNTNFFLLAFIIEKIADKKFEEFMEDNIFKPLEMNSSKNPVEGNLSKLKNSSNYRELVEQFLYNPLDYSVESIRNKIYTNVSVLKGTCSVISSAPDLLKWNQSLHKNSALLPKELYQLVVTNYAKEFNNIYGYGIMAYETSAGMVYSHTGEIDGFQAILRYYKDDDISLIIFNNVGPDMSVYSAKISEMEESLRSKVANPITRKIIADGKVKAQYPDKRNFITLLQEIDDTTIEEKH